MREPVEVATEKGGEVGVHDSGRRSLVLPELRQDLVRCGDVDVGKLGPESLRDRPFVIGVEVREEKADRDGLGARVTDRPHDPVHLAVVERIDLALRADPLPGAEAQIARDQRDRLGGTEPVKVGPVLARDLEHVREALGRHERGSGSTLGQQRVGADRHPVGEDLHVRGIGADPFEHRLHCGKHPARHVVRRRWRLGGVQLGAVEDDGVGERSTDVDPEKHAPSLSNATRQAARRAPPIPGPLRVGTSPA